MQQLLEVTAIRAQYAKESASDLDRGLNHAVVETHLLEIDFDSS